MDSGASASLHVNYRHHTISVKFNLQTYYLPPYERVVLYLSMQIQFILEKLYPASIGKGTSQEVNEMINIPREAISNALNIYIPHEMRNL